MVARLADVPEAVVDALTFPTLAHTTTVEAATIPFFVRSWGQTTEKPLLLLHGITSSSLGWWRVGSGLAGAGFRVFAPDMPGHGRTGSWRGHWRFRDTARDLVALVDALGISRNELRLVGHSWGAMTAAAFPHGVGGRGPSPTPQRDDCLDRPCARTWTVVPERTAGSGESRGIWVDDARRRRQTIRDRSGGGPRFEQREDAP